MEKAIKVGWIGTGVMGKSMAGHLLTNGYQLSIYTRTKAKADELISRGAQWQNIQEIASQSDFLFLMLGYPHDVEDVVFNNATGVLNHMKAGSVLIDHTTSSPGQAMRIFEEASKRSVHFIDAPVSGGDIGARSGKLVTMAGGDSDALEKAMSLLKCYSAEVQHMGPAGAGQQTKACN
jgi:3-hydroxyisobutyrate dehydrogenase